MHHMKKIILLINLVLIASISFSQNEEQGDEFSNCLKKTSSKWAGNCSQCQSNLNTYRVNLTNICAETLDVKIAVQEKTKKWRSFFLLNVLPNDSVSAYACNGTGKYIFWARKASDNEINFPTDEEINLTYTK